MIESHKKLCKYIKKSTILTNNLEDSLSKMEDIKTISKDEKYMIDQMKTSTKVKHKSLQNLYTKYCE